MKRVLFYGDSNTYGYDPRLYSPGRYPEENIWTTILSKKLFGKWEILANGLNGRPIPNLKYDKRHLDILTAEDQKLDLFAVMLGTNDVVFSMEPNARAIARKMERFLQYLLERSENQTKFEIMLIAPVWIGAQTLSDPAYMNFWEASAVLNEGYRKLAVKYGITFADAQEFGIELASDYIHFTEQGHRVFAEQMADVLTELQ